MRFIVHFILSVVFLSGQVLAAGKDLVPGIYSPGFYSVPNFIINPSCISNIKDITNASSILTRTTTTPNSNVASCLIDSTAGSQVVKFIARPFDLGMVGQSCEALLTYTGNGTGYTAYVEQPAGTKVSQDFSLVDQSTGSQTVSLTFPCRNATDAVNVVIASSGNHAAIEVSDVQAGKLVSSVGASVATDWVNYTPTGGWVTNATYTGKWRRVGDSLHIMARVDTSGAVTGTFALGLPSGFTIDTAKMNSPTQFFHSLSGSSVASDSGSAFALNVAYNTTTTVALLSGGTGQTVANATNPFTFGAGDFVTLDFIVPVVGATSTGIAVRADQSNYPWTAYTPTFTGFGTVTGVECQHKRDAEDLLVRCKAASGTPTATEARVSLPGSLVAAATDKIPSIQKAGEFSRGVAAGSSFSFNVLQEPNVSYMTFGIQGSAAAGMTKALGNALVGATETFSFTARIPIAGWLENQKAPLLVGSVTSASQGAERIERLRFTNAGTPTIASQSGSWVSSLTDTAQGQTTVNIPAGTFSAAPTCTCNANGVANQDWSCNVSETSATSVLVRTYDFSTNGYLDFDTSVICMGPR